MYQSVKNFIESSDVKLRDIAKALNIEITYDTETNTVSIEQTGLNTRECYQNSQWKK